MNLKFEIKRGQYTTDTLRCNGFEVGHVSYSIERNDPVPQHACLSFLGRSYLKKFTDREDAFEWMRLQFERLLSKVCGESES